MAKILLVEDDIELAEGLVRLLNDEQHSVELAHSAEDASKLSPQDFDLLILDWQLPSMSGVELLTQFRQRGVTLPILMLTGKQTTPDKEIGLDSGADDYLTKPFDSRELVIRIRALLRRPANLLDNTLRWGDLEVDTISRTVTRNKEEIEFQPLEFMLLECLLRHPDQVFSTDQLMHSCWNTEKTVSIESIYTCIRRIRRKLDTKDRSIIESVHSVGYRLGQP